MSHACVIDVAAALTLLATAASNPWRPYVVAHQVSKDRKTEMIRYGLEVLSPHHVQHTLAAISKLDLAQLPEKGQTKAKLLVDGISA